MEVSSYIMTWLTSARFITQRTAGIMLQDILVAVSWDAVPLFAMFRVHPPNIDALHIGQGRETAGRLRQEVFSSQMSQL